MHRRFERPSAKPGHWRKAKESRTSSTNSLRPPPPTKTVGGGGRISREICRFSPFGPSFGGRGSNHREKCKVLGCSLGTATGLGLRRAVHSGHLTSSPPFQVIMARMVFS